MADTLIVCLLTRTIQRDALRSTDGVHTRLPDAPEASYCSRGPAEQPESLTRALCWPAERRNWNWRPDGITERDGLAAPLSLSLRSKKKEACGKRCLRTLTSSQMCVSHSSVCKSVCMCVCMLFSLFDTLIAYMMEAFITYISEAQRTAIKMH